MTFRRIRPSRFRIALVGIFSLLALSSACSNSSAPLESEVQAAAIETSAALTAEADLLTETSKPPTQTPTPTITPTPEYVTLGSVVTESINLREGPGTIFEVIDRYLEGAQVYATGISPDRAWVQVLAKSPDDPAHTLEGWMFADLIEFTRPLDILPVVDINQKWIIQGKVTETDGAPVNGIRVAALSTTDAGEELRAEATTGESGEFTIYLPADQTGSFDVQIVAANCNSRISSIIEGECIVADYFPVDSRTDVLLPQSQVVVFTYERGVTHLTGKVVYQDGYGASQVLVKATRLADGVESEWVTGVGGEFSLPLGLGIWEVVGIRFLPDGTPLFSKATQYTITEDAQVLEPLIIPYNDLSLENAPQN